MTHHQEKCAHCKGAGLVEVFNMGDVCSDCNGIGVAPSPKDHEKCEVTKKLPDWMDCNCKCHGFEGNDAPICPHCHPEKYDLITDCCGSREFDPFGFSRGDGTYDEKCLKCGKMTDVHYRIVPAPSPHTEGMEEILDDLDMKLERLFNLGGWALIAFVEGNITEEERAALLDEWNTQGRKYMSEALHQTREDTLAKEINNHFCCKNQTVNPEDFCDDCTKHVIEQRQRLKEGKV